MRNIYSRLAIVFLCAVTFAVISNRSRTDAQEEAAAVPTSPPKTSRTTLAPKKKLPAGELKSNVEFFPQPSKADLRIEAALAELTTVEFLETPLSDALSFLSKAHKIPILTDKTSLDDFGIDTDEPVSAQLKEVTLRSALLVMIDELQLTYEIRNEILYITAKDTAFDRMTNRVYPVADLVTADKDSYEELIDAIQETTETEWLDTHGSGGSASIVRATASVSILQSYRGHQAVVQFLRSIRQAKAAQTIYPKRAAPPEPDEFGPAPAPAETVEGGEPGAA